MNLPNDFLLLGSMLLKFKKIQFLITSKKLFRSRNVVKWSFLTHLYAFLREKTTILTRIYIIAHKHYLGRIPSVTAAAAPVAWERRRKVKPFLARIPRRINPQMAAMLAQVLWHRIGWHSGSSPKWRNAPSQLQSLATSVGGAMLKRCWLEDGRSLDLMFPIYQEIGKDVRHPE